MKRLVLDASVALAWSLDQPASAYADKVARLLSSGVRAIVPALWHLEVANGFAVAERRKSLTRAQTMEALSHLDHIVAHSIEDAAESFSIRAIVAVSREFSLTAYDAVYLETALRQRLPLASLDRALLAAASKAGVETVS